MEARAKHRLVGFTKIKKGTKLYNDLIHLWEVKTLARVNAARALRGQKPVNYSDEDEEKQLKLERETLRSKAAPWQNLIAPGTAGSKSNPLTPRSQPPTPGRNL